MSEIEFSIRDNGVTLQTVPFSTECEPLPEFDKRDPTTQPIMRCGRCRAYVNKHTKWVESFERWRCVFCKMVNEVPEDVDLETLPEIKLSQVEMLVPEEFYCKYPPAQTNLIFLVDTASQQGLWQALTGPSACPDARVCIIVYGSTTQVAVFGDEPSWLESSNVDPADAFMAADQVAEHLPSLEWVEQTDETTALEDALRFVTEVSTLNASKVIQVSSNRPVENTERFASPFYLASATVMNGALDIPSALCTASSLVVPGALGVRDFLQNQKLDTSSTLYDWIIKATDSQATFDLIAPADSNQYLVANTGGTFTELDQESLAQQIRDAVERTAALEVVIRTRCSRGMTITNHYGSCRLRSAREIVSYASIAKNQQLIVQIEGTPRYPDFDYVQIAILFTDLSQTRRVRVLTFPVPRTDE
ncbi:MAG: hypothetical protein CMP20_04480 [Rickettsiales bacterium]|nr:hypothetical protein [Rickettsiales bacterium]